MCQKFLRDTLCHVATSKLHLSATSRRGFSMSRRHFNTPLSRRDVYCHVATSNFKALCHVATWISHVATWISHVATSLLHVATSFGHLLCHVATWPRTSRRLLVMFSVTSRRELERHDVGLFALCHVATSPRMSRRDPVFSPRMAHFGHSPHAPSLTRTLAPLRPTLHRTCRRPHPTGRRPSTARRPL